MRIISTTATAVFALSTALWGQHPPPHAMGHPGGAAPKPAPKRANPPPTKNPGQGSAANNKNEAPIERVDRLAQMPPQQRQKFLESLPPDRREKVSQQLENWQKLTPEQRARRLDQLHKFEALNPQQQQEVRQAGQKLKALPDDRRLAVQKELGALRNMPAEQRNTRMNSPAFKNNFSPEEQQILQSSLLPEQQ